MRTELVKALAVPKQYPSVEELVAVGVNIQKTEIDLAKIRGTKGRKDYSNKR